VGSGITTSGMQFNVHSYLIDTSSNALTFSTGNNTISTNFTSASGNTTSINGAVAGTGANLLFSAVNAPTVLPVGHMVSFGGTSVGGWTGSTTIGRDMIVRLQESNQALVDSDGITLQGGIIVLKSGELTATLDRIDNSAAINSYGGSIRTAHENLVNNTAYSESMGNLTLHGGNTVLLHDTRINFNGTSGMSGTMIFNNISRADGSFATLYAGARDNLQTGASGTGYRIRNTGFGGVATPTNEIIGPWLTAGNNTSGSEYGRYDASGNIISAAYSGLNNGNVEANLSTSWSSTANFNWNAGANANAIDLANNVTLNSLRMQNTNAINLGDFVFATNGLTGAGMTIQTAGTGYLTAAGNSGSGNAIYLSAMNGNITLTAPIKDNGNPVSAVLTTGTNGAVVNLNGANEHTGGTIINAAGVRLVEGQGGGGARVELGHASGLGANTNRLSVQSGTLDLNSISPTIGKFDGYTAGTVTGNSGAVLTVGQGTIVSDTSNFAGSIIGADVAFTKTGAGTQTLSGSSTYTGTTLVSAGTLLVNGSLGGSAVTVDSGAFGGSGTIGSTLGLNAGTFFHVVDLMDPLAVSGTVTIYAGFGVDDLAGLNWGTVSAGTYTLIDGTLGTGVFDALAHNSLLEAYNVGFGKSAYFQQGSLQLVVIPEPSAALLGSLGIFALLRRRRN
jgi:autotransporter-associated beta strand protein